MSLTKICCERSGADGEEEGEGWRTEAMGEEGAGEGRGREEMVVSYIKLWASLTLRRRLPSVCRPVRARSARTRPAIPVLLLAFLAGFHSWQKSREAEPSAVIRGPVKDLRAVLCWFPVTIALLSVECLSCCAIPSDERQSARGFAEGDTPAPGRPKPDHDPTRTRTRRALSPDST